MSTTATTERGLVVIESMFGNTERVARAIADGLRGEGLDVELRNVSPAPQHLTGDYDLLVVGAPTHTFSLSRPSTRSDARHQDASAERTATGVRQWLQDLAWVGRPPATAVFDTRVSKVRRLPWAAGRKATALLIESGLRPSYAGLVRASSASSGARDTEP